MLIKIKFVSSHSVVSLTPATTFPAVLVHLYYYHEFHHQLSIIPSLLQAIALFINHLCNKRNAGQGGVVRCLCDTEMGPSIDLCMCAWPFEHPVPYMYILLNICHNYGIVVGLCLWMHLVHLMERDNG